MSEITLYYDKNYREVDKAKAVKVATITYDEISGTIILAESVLQPEYNECGEI